MDNKNIEYKDLMVPLGMRVSGRGMILGLFGSGIGSEYMYLKTLLKGMVNLVEVSKDNYGINLKLVNMFKLFIKEDNVISKDFSSISVVDDINVNTILVKGLECYLKSKNIVNTRVEYNNILKYLMYFTQTYTNLKGTKLINDKVVYYGDISSDIVEYFNFLNILGIDVIYLSLNVKNVDLIKSVTDNIKIVGDSGEDKESLKYIINETTSFKTRTQDAVDMHIGSSHSYSTSIRRLNNSIYDFSSLYDINTEFREYYEKDGVDKVIHLPVYYCNIIGYNNIEFKELLSTILKASNTHYINDLSGVLLDLSTNELSSMGMGIDFKSLSVNTDTDYFRGYNKDYLDKLLSTVADVMSGLNISIANSKGKMILVAVFYSLIRLGVSIDVRSTTQKYVINNYKGLMADDNFRVLVSSLSKLGSDIVILSASEELEGLHNIQLGNKVYTRDGNEGITSIGNLIDSIAKGNTKKNGNFFSRLLDEIIG